MSEIAGRFRRFATEQGIIGKKLNFAGRRCGTRNDGGPVRFNPHKAESWLDRCHRVGLVLLRGLGLGLREGRHILGSRLALRLCLGFGYRRCATEEGFAHAPGEVATLDAVYCGGARDDAGDHDPGGYSSSDSENDGSKRTGQSSLLKDRMGAAETALKNR